MFHAPVLPVDTDGHATGSCTTLRGPALFLDRDGVINQDHGFVHQMEQFDLLPGVVAALRRLQAAFAHLIIVTNQSGIGRGLYTESQYRELTAWMLQSLGTRGVQISAVYHCPHRPDATCPCRKPAPGMILEAANDFQLDLSESWMVGDKPSDVLAARRAGVPGQVLLSPKTLAAEEGVLVRSSLGAAVDAILAQRSIA